MSRPASFIAAVFAVLFSAPGWANCGPTGCVGFIDQIYIEANGNLYVQTSGVETGANCTPDNGVYLFLARTAANFKEVYALLLSAQAQERQVRLRVVEGSNPCAISWAALDR